MRYVRTGLRALGGAALLTAALATGAGAATPAKITLRGTQSPAAARTPRIGAVASETSIEFEVNLRVPDQAGAQAFATAVSTPGSSSYGAYLTPAQWEARFSPSSADVASVRAFLTQNGFRVTGVSADRLSVSASGTAAQVQQTFGTALSYHRVQGQSLLLADRDLSIPAALGDLVGGITGVSDTIARPGVASDDYPQPPGFRAAPPCASWYGEKLDAKLPPFPGYGANPPWAVCGYTGPQLRSAYNLGGAADGSGVTVAIVDAYAAPTLFSDAHRFAALNDPGNPLRSGQFSELLAPTFNQGGVDKCDAGGWYGEETLDVEAVHDTAPGASILFAGAKNCNNGPLYGMDRRIVDGHLADVITNSWGDDGGDVLDTASDRQAMDNILEMAAATGVSVLFSSGDNGDEFTTIGQVAADYPSSSPWATAVGGTTLQIGRFGQRLGEYGWSTARSQFCNAALVAQQGCTSDQLGTWLPIDEALDGGSGGGTSAVYPQPFYQQGVVPASLSQAGGGAPMRVEPDVSLEADPATGMLVGETQVFPDGTYYDQYRIGGTSVASPLLAGIVARADQARGGPVGFLNPALYSLYGRPGAFYDVQGTHQDMSRADYADEVDTAQGILYSTRIIDYEGPEQYCDPTSGQCTTRQVALSTAPGFDSMTGLGSPGDGFVQALSRR